MILHKLERMDAKIDSMSLPPQPSAITPSMLEESPASPSSSKTTPISFSARRMLSWPGIRDLLPPSLGSVTGDYALKLEENRPKLSISTRGQAGDILADLSISTVRELSDAYFATFNLANPVLDRKLYFQQTLGTAINGGFGYDAESCVVLMTMALGTFGMQALNECPPNSPSLERRGSSYSPADPPGLGFYNEARKRLGFLEGEHSLHACQFYLLAAVYHGQLLRPVDCWSMTMRSAVICLKLWDTPPDTDDWTRDMYSRMFWITVMYQTVLTQELIGLPTSKIRDMEDKVPLPKFVPYSSNYPTGQEEEDESFYHYHFLSQIAHRIFLTRVYTSIYYSSELLLVREPLSDVIAPSGDYPNAALARELYHQLDRWRSQLPTTLRFDDETPIAGPEPLSDVLVVSLLRSRYFVAQYHLGRPFL